MKKLKYRLLNRMNLLLGTLIALIGVGCKSQKNALATDAATNGTIADTREERIMAMYGIPTATYKITGEVTNAGAAPAVGMQVVVRKNAHSTDTVYTDREGRFESLSQDFPTDSVEVSVTDPTGTYLPATEKAAVEYKGKNGTWDYGTGTASFKILLQRKRGSGQSISVKYGVPRPPQTTISDK